MFKVINNNSLVVVGRRASYRDAVELALSMGLWGEDYSITL